MNKNILEVKFTKINDAYSVGEIVYQDEKILERGVFDDKNLKISSFVKPALEGHMFLIRGKYRQEDTIPFVIKNEHLEDLKDRINKLNKKYGHKKIWLPKKNEDYYYLNTRYNPIKRQYLGQDWEQPLIELYLVFPTLELAKKGKYLSIIDRMQILYQYSRNCLFEPKNEQYHYKLDFDIISRKFVSVHVEGLNGIGVCWEKEEDLINFINENQKDLIKILNNFNNL